MMNLAPIGVSTYSRLHHLKQTIEALQNNKLASQSVLYVFSDAPKPGDEEKVRVVRDFLKTIEGFKQVEIIERKTNSRTHNNRQGMRMLLEKYGKLIFLEEDVVTAPSFLDFMNQALEVYEHNPKVFSISGYCPPIKIPKDYPHDVFLLPRFSAWGFGIWKDRFDLIKMTLPTEQVIKSLNSIEYISSFGLGGLDMINMVRKDALGEIDGLDVKVFYWQHQFKMDTVYPVKSLVRNIGLDGTGQHSRKSNRLDVKLEPYRESPDFPFDIRRDQRIIRANFRLRLRGHKWYRPPLGSLWLVPFLAYRAFHKIDV